MREYPRLNVHAFVHVGDELVDVDTLTPEMRQRLAEQLSLTWYNTLYAGRAVFRIQEDAEPQNT